jgi:hypothetical protein
MRWTKTLIVRDAKILHFKEEKMEFVGMVDNFPFYPTCLYLGGGIDGHGSLDAPGSISHIYIILYSSSCCSSVMCWW